MKNIINIAAIAVALTATSANAFWGGPFFGNGTGDGTGDVSFSMNTRSNFSGNGNSYGYDAPNYGYAPYGQAPYGYARNAPVAPQAADRK